MSNTTTRVGPDGWLVRDPINDPPDVTPRWSIVQDAGGSFHLSSGDETRPLDWSLARRLIREAGLSEPATQNLTIRMPPSMLASVRAAAKAAGVTSGEYGRTAIARAVFGDLSHD